MSIFHSKEFCDLHGITLHKGIFPVRNMGGFNGNTRIASPGRGTFGGFLRGDEKEISEALKDAQIFYGMQVHLISMAPVSHDPRLFSRSVGVLDKNKYKVAWGDINYDLEVDEKPLSKRMVSGHRKKLAKCERAGFYASEVDDLSKVYALLDADRKRKGRKLSMSFDELHRQNAALPDTCQAFGVFDAFSKLQSAAITFRIKPDVQYVFAWGDTGASEYVPTIILASHIYDYCQENNIRMLDVGIATEHGVPNRGLMQFKQNLGFTQSLKLTMKL